MAVSKAQLEERLQVLQFQHRQLLDTYQKAGADINAVSGAIQAITGILVDSFPLDEATPVQAPEPVAAEPEVVKKRRKKATPDIS